MAAVSAIHLRNLAACRAEEAQALLQLGHHAGAYYLAGYALECGLKALIANGFEAGKIPEVGMGSMNEETAGRLMDAMFGAEYGVFQWIRSKW